MSSGNRPVPPPKPASQRYSLLNPNRQTDVTTAPVRQNPVFRTYQLCSIHVFAPTKMPMKSPAQHLTHCFFFVANARAVYKTTPSFRGDAVTGVLFDKQLGGQPPGFVISSLLVSNAHSFSFQLMSLALFPLNAEEINFFLILHSPPSLV